MKLRALIAILGAAIALTACVSTKTDQVPSVSFIEPVDGAVVSSPFKVKFAVSGMEVKPAGEIVPNTGHHHLFIDGVSAPQGEAIPADSQHMHFGKGQTEAQISLPPGPHKLTMQFANGAHQSYGAGMSRSINITVK